MAPRSGLYHHYVPRFILRYFAAHKRTSYSIDEQSGDIIERLAKAGSCFIADSSGIIQCDGQLVLQSKTTPWYLAQDRINVYHLSDTRLVMATEHDAPEDFANTISRNFGLPGLYDDPSHREVDHIEKLFSDLESKAAIVIAAAVSALDSPKQELRIARKELNALRKFLFLLGFRNNSRGQQFFDNSFDDATRRNIDHHIETQNFPAGSTARDVWLQNLKEILVTDYAYIPENRRIFGLDRDEFVVDMREKRIVFWRASDDGEFITCNNGCGFIDGAEVTRRLSPAEARMVADRMRGVGLLGNDSRRAASGFFQWSRLFPVHPKLVIALVHNSLMSLDKETQFVEELGLKARSLYRDLPKPAGHRITPLTASADGLRVHQNAGRGSVPFTYGPQDGSLHSAAFIDGKPGESYVKDKFVFPLLRLSSEQTHRINGMFLENVGDVLAFRSPRQLYRSIIAYERNSIWEHKRAYGPLKDALRMWSQSPTIPARPLVPDSGERQIIWVSSGRSGTDLRACVDEIRQARRLGLRGIPIRRCQAELVRTHDDSLLRNEEAHRDRQRPAPTV